MGLTRAFSRLLISGIFIHAGVSKLTAWSKTVTYTHDTMDANGFALDKLFGLDDAGLVPMLLGIALFLELVGAFSCFVVCIHMCMMVVRVQVGCCWR